MGLIAIDLDEGDRLVGAAVTNGEDHVMLLSSNGKAIRFEEGNVRAMGRTARGVRGMRLQGDAEVISLIIPRSTQIDDSDASDDESDASAAIARRWKPRSRPAVDAGDEQIYILTASQRGYGKRTRLEAFPLRGRGGQGVIAMQTSARNGDLVSAIQVHACDEMMLITDRGTLVRTRVEEVSATSRNTQGVMLIRLGEGESLVKTVRVDEPAEEAVEVADDTVPDDTVPGDTVPATPRRATPRRAMSSMATSRGRKIRSKAVLIHPCDCS